MPCGGWDMLSYGHGIVRQYRVLLALGYVEWRLLDRLYVVFIFVACLGVWQGYSAA